MQNNWINVNDRLPKQMELVLFAEAIASPNTFTIGYIRDGKWHTEISDNLTVDAGYSGGVIVDDTESNYITHWQPLPEAPNKQTT